MGMGRGWRNLDPHPNEDEEGGLESTLAPLTRVLWRWSQLEMWDAVEAVPGGGGGGGVLTLPSRDRILESSCLSCHRFPMG